ncbi:MAG: hypothetical protein WDM92_12040 [Caulobacteraceae bacterium]
MRSLVIILVAIFAVSCSKADANKTSADLKAAAHSVTHDPQVRVAAADIKKAAKDAGVQIKKGAVEAKHSLAKAGVEAKHSADKATDKLDNKDG